MKTLYHGTGQKIDNASYLYFTEDIKEAKQYALALNDLGEYNQESYIYSCDIDETNVVVEDDFDVFDSLAYTTKIECIIFNPETGWYIVPNPNIVLTERYDNKL